MRCRLGQVAVDLLSDSPQIGAYWERLFTGPSTVSRAGPQGDPLSLSLQLADALTLPSSADRIYRDAKGILDVYSISEGGYALHFLQGALVNLRPDRYAFAHGTVTAQIFDYDRLEDVTYVSLAALLRRRGRYLAHAAAVSTGGDAILFVGPSHSGKTTTGLALLLAGCKHISSDVVILSQSDDAVVAHPTPGLVNVRAGTFELLPALRQLGGGGRLQLKAEQWSDPAPIAAICFPDLTSQPQSSLEPLDASVALAQLMEESVDRWDSAVLLEHMEFLTTLSRQASHYRLLLGSDIDTLPQRLLEAL